MSVHVSVVFVVVTAWNIAATDGATAEGAIRLINGHNSSEGRVEIYLQGEWGTICDDHWDILAATVVCKQLGFLDAISAVGNAEFGEGSGPIQLDDLHCVGNESALTNCSARPIKEHNCDHSEDAGVRCNVYPSSVAEGALRLVNGNNASEGRVEIYLQGQWGTICDDLWDIREATVVCKQLGFLDAISAVGGAEFGEGSGPIQLDDLHCVGNESALTNCSARPIKEHNCAHSEDAGVRCNVYISTEGTIRLVNGHDSSEGRVEIYLQGQWGTICDDLWDIREATVVCKQLGFLDAISAVGSAGFGEGSGPIQLDDLYCVGNESALTNCSARSIEQHSCNHSEDAGVRCNPCPLNRQIRLVDGTVAREGRVEVRSGCYGEWGTICDDQWDSADAQTTCRQLGYNTTGGAVAYGSATYGQGTGDILLSDLKCSGKENSLFECPHNRSTVNCHHYDDAGASCPPCHEIVATVTRVARQRVSSYVDYYRGGFLNWRRKSRTVYRTVTYYVYVMMYSMEEVPCPVNGGWGSCVLGKCNVTCGKGYLNCTRECNNPAPAHKGSDCVGSDSKVYPCDEGCCPVDGGWSSWRHGPCSKTCGGGMQTSTRRCDNPTPFCGGSNCSGSDTRQSICNAQCCLVHGGWSLWGSGLCSKTCGGGIKTLTRRCNNPAPSCGGNACPDLNSRQVTCNNQCCPVHGGWSSWNLGPCSKTCGGGIRNDTRTCNNPTPSCGGLSCTGSSTREEACNKFCCHVHGGWSSWTEGSCSKTCGGGIKIYTRSCNNPTPSCGGLSCKGISTRLEGCNKFCCRVHGRWSLWKPVGKCSKTCGGGIQKFIRTCNNPAPSCGGISCRGISIFEASCNTFCCHVDGGWSNWSAGNCSKLCDHGTKEKTRSCSNPAPSCGGKDCIGEIVETVECNIFPCIGPWSNWSRCSVSCGNGIKYRTRTCITNCENGTIQYKDCYMGCCPVDGGWSSWYNQTECSVSCGGGVLTQWRNCTQPSPSCNGSDCQGENVNTIHCNTHCCPVDGGWSNWSAGSCSKLCDGGNKTKIRTCSNPTSSCGGSNCVGETVETVECNTIPCIGSWSNWSECSVTCGKGKRLRNRTCVIGCNRTTEHKECNMGCCRAVDGGWSEWRLGPCSKTCGGGVQNYFRVCDNPKPSCGGKGCEGLSFYAHKELCNSKCCPVDGKWSDWQNVTNCSTTCGEGVITQQRTCTQPSPSCGGRECLGENTTTIPCNNCCPVDGGWSDWKNMTSCSTTCGEGVITKQRTCTQPSPSCGGRDCLGESITNVSCNNCCPVDGGWSEWEHGPCTKTCGGGKMSMIRKCNNPEPSCGGSECVGSNNFPLQTPCNDFCCLVDGGWSQWKDISGCSGTCGEGIKVQTRTCSEPPSSCGGKYCEGPGLQFVPCNVSACCPVNGNWTEWRLGPCSKTCGGGVHNYTRVCENPKPSCGGKECDGLAIYTPKEKCNNFCCPVDGGWSSWLVGNCTASCVKQRNRFCNSPAPSCGGKNCSGPTVEIMMCKELPCEDGWGNWSKCSVTCGNGTKFRTRECTGECKDKSIEIQYKPCYRGCCPVDGGWNDWVFGPCSKTCGGGMQNITRECNKPKPSCNGKDCDGPNYYVYPIKCNNFCCPVDGGWSDWHVGSCSVTCGGGIKEKFRLCDNPTPSCGGKQCSGSNIENEECNESPCK